MSGRPRQTALEPHLVRWTEECVDELEEAENGARGSPQAAEEEGPRGKGTPDFPVCCYYHRTGGALEVGCRAVFPGPRYELTDRGREELERIRSELPER